MRTTLAIDDDLLGAARAIARRERRPVGTVVSDLIRKGLEPARPVQAMRNGLPIYNRSDFSVPITLELVNALRDELP